MKRIIITALCVTLTVALFAQKSLIIHQKDGTKIEIPINAINSFNFVGKAIVNDNDYTSLSNVTLRSDANLCISLTANFHSEDPYIHKDTPIYGENWGILYSTTPNITVESGTLLRPNADQTSVVTNIANGSFSTQLGKSNKPTIYDINLEYETDYYIRSFVRRPGNNGIYSDEYFFSKEVKVNTGKPAMAYYGVTADPEKYARTGYIMPTDSAWASLSERAPYFSKDSLLEVWNDYLTAERIAAIKPQCNTVYNCCDGTLYMLDNIADDFIEYAINLYADEYIMTGYTANTLYCSEEGATLYECDETWNVPNNRYWEYQPMSRTSCPQARFTFSKPLYANYNYKVEITFAPNAIQSDTLPTKYNVSFYGMNAENKLKKLYEIKELQTNVYSTTVTTLDSISAPGFGMAELRIQAKGTRTEIVNKKLLNVLRIAQIKVTAIGPCIKQD